MQENDNKQQYETEKKSDFISSIVKAFDIFVETFKKHGLASVTFILVLFMFFYSFILNPVDINTIVKEALKKESIIKQEEMNKSIQQRLEADKMINSLMSEIIDEFDVNRCILLSLHNGSASIANVEYLFYSATNEMISTNNKNGEDVYDISYEADGFQRQLIGNLIGNATFKRLIHEPYIYFSDLERYHRNNFRFIYKMQQIGANSCMMIPFVNNNIPELVLVVSSKEPTLPAQQIYNLVEKYRSRIEINLMNI